MSSLEKYIQARQELFAANGQKRSLYTYTKRSPTTMRKDTGIQDYTSFNDNDYFNLSHHPDVIAKTIEATQQYGMGIRASRLVTGNHPLYTEIEQLLATFKKSEAALVFGSGYLTHIGIIPALAGKGDLIIADKLIHASMIDGAKLSGATLLRFTHNNIESCKNLLKKHRHLYRHCLILTETIFSMDGDVAPIAKLFELANQHDSLLITDDAHGFGFLPDLPAHIHMGTLSKAIGCYGGYVCASEKIVSYLTNTARSFIYSTALPTPILAGILAALTLLTNNNKIINYPIDNAKYFTKEMQLPPAQSPIVPYLIGDSTLALAAAAKLEQHGFLVPAIRPPTVPKNTARLRFTFSAAHTKKQLNNIIKILKEHPYNA